MKGLFYCRKAVIPMAKKFKATELVKFARSKIGTPYIYGCKGEVLTQEKYDYLQKTYGTDYVWKSDASKIGSVCVDCSGLISWHCNVMRGSAQWFAKATEKHPISEIDKAPVGALLYMKGHITIYSGFRDGKYWSVGADGSKYGVQEVPITFHKFTHWLLAEDIFEYDTKEDDEVVTQENIIVNGEEYTVKLIRKDDITYLCTRDIAPIFNFDVDYKGAMPILTKKK